MKKLGIILLSSMLLLMNSCSETSSPGLEWHGDEEAVRFTATMQPSVEIIPTRAADGLIDGTTLPVDGKVGIFGIRTQAGAELPTWEEATFHRQMKNKQYLVEEGNTLSPQNGELDYHPMGDSLLTVCAYMPYSEAVTADGYLPVNLSEQIDILYTGTQTAGKRQETVALPFKHALGAVAFRFYTDEVALDGTAISHITLTLNYNPSALKMSLTDGSMQGTSVQDGVGYFVPLSGATVPYSLEPSTIAPIGHTMLAPGEEFCITGLALTYGDNTTTEKTLDNPVTLEVGRMTVLHINCKLQKLPENILQLDRSNYTTRSTTAADSGITFTLEKITTE